MKLSAPRIPGSTVFDKLKARLTGLLEQGMQARQLALALTLGATIGLLPTVWGTSVLCILLAWIFRLNHLVVQLANYLVYPLQIILFIPYFQLGETLYSSQNLPENLNFLLESLHAAPLTVLENYWQANLQAVTVWLLTVPLLLICGFPLTLLFVTKLLPDQSNR